MIRDRRFLPAAGFVAAALAAAAGPALAHSGHNPFAVAGHEGSADPTGIGGWILAQQTVFYRMITGAVRATRANGSAVWALAGISFAYGVFHAAGPGHGKAVVASYMLANERALRRGLAISFVAALLQGAVAIAIVTVAALVLGATAQRITQSTDVVEMASYAGVALLGAWLLWRKGRGLAAALRGAAPMPAADRSVALAPLAVAPQWLAQPAAAVGACLVCEPLPSQRLDGRPGHHHPNGDGGPCSHSQALAIAPTETRGHVHDEHCGHFHAPDPATLGDGFSWRGAILTVFSAGARPCSGAILVLVFALAQGIFVAGVAATLAMSLGTGITTAALAATAVLFKGIAVRLVGGGSRRKEIIARGVEVAAAVGVLIVGVGLLFGAWDAGA
jgi:nickel/cobalt exporter